MWAAGAGGAGMIAASSSGRRFGMDDRGTSELFVRFLQEPTRENYLAVFEVVTNDPDYDPYSNDLERVGQLLEQGKFAEAVERGYGLMPKWLLSPRIHLLVSMAHERAGDEKGAEMERMIAFRCLEGIENPGDGTRASPYLVTSTADEYDVLGARGKKMLGQSLHHDGERHLDRMEVEGGGEVWFDITKVYGRLAARMDRRKGRA